MPTSYSNHSAIIALRLYTPRLSQNQIALYISRNLQEKNLSSVVMKGSFIAGVTVLLFVLIIIEVCSAAYSNVTTMEDSCHPLEILPNRLIFISYIKPYSQRVL